MIKYIIHNTLLKENMLCLLILKPNSDKLSPKQNKVKLGGNVFDVGTTRLLNMAVTERVLDKIVRESSVRTNYQVIRVFQNGMIEEYHINKSSGLDKKALIATCEVEANRFGS